MKDESAKSTDIWSMTEAVRRFSALVAQSQLRPQTIMRRGVVVAVIPASAPPARPGEREGPLAGVLLSCPHRWDDDPDFRNL